MARALTLSDLQKMFEAPFPVDWVVVPSWNMPNIVELSEVVLPPNEIATNLNLKPDHERTPTIAGLKMCTTCKKSAGQSTDLELLQCSVCKVSKYCSKECQRQNWKHHKEACTIQRKAYLDARVTDNIHYMMSLVHKHKVARESNDPEYIPFFWTRDRWDALREAHWHITNNDLSHHRENPVKVDNYSFVDFAMVFSYIAYGADFMADQIIWTNYHTDDKYLAQQQLKMCGRADLISAYAATPTENQKAKFDMPGYKASDHSPVVDNMD